VWFVMGRFDDVCFARTRSDASGRGNRSLRIRRWTTTQSCGCSTKSCAAPTGCGGTIVLDIGCGGTDHPRGPTDADSPLPSEGFDVAIRRFGTMFFADPVAAFANIAPRALRRDGRLVMMVLMSPGGFAWPPWAVPGGGDTRLGSQVSEGRDRYHSHGPRIWCHPACNGIPASPDRPPGRLAWSRRCRQRLRVRLRLGDGHRRREPERGNEHLSLWECHPGRWRRLRRRHS
jgi:hypothetical protein